MPSFRRITALVTVAAVGLVLATLAVAAGGRTIAEAPVVPFGQQMFGNTAAQPRLSDGRSEFWRLALTAGDAVTINWEEDLVGDNRLAIYDPSITDFNLSVNEERYYSTGANSKAQTKFRAVRSGSYTLRFWAFCYLTCNEPSAYDFVAYVRHAARLLLPPMTRLSVRATVKASVRTPDGKPITNSALKLRLFGKWSGKQHLLASATPRTGQAKFRLRLPNSARQQQLRLWVVGQGKGWQAARSSSRSVRVR